MPRRSLQFRLNIIIYNNATNIEASRGAEAQSVTVKPTGCGFDPYVEEMKYLLKFIFPFLRSGVKNKRSVEFCHSIRNASRIWKKVKNGVS